MKVQIKYDSHAIYIFNQYHPDNFISKINSPIALSASCNNNDITPK